VPGYQRLEPMIPRVAHFVHGLREQDEPLHFLHFASIESCRRVLAPERIYFHYRHLPSGVWWERIRPHLTLVPVEPVDGVLRVDYARGSVTERRDAHDGELIRLDALIEHGGVYADIDTIFVREFPDELFEQEFVIGRGPSMLDERTGERRQSLCDALLMAQPDSAFARAWRERVAGALDDSWSKDGGLLLHELSEQMSGHLRVEPQERFFAFPAGPRGISQLLCERHEIPRESLSVQLWTHLWWERRRRDFTDAHAGWTTPSFVRSARTSLAELLRPYLDERAPPAREPWSYISADDVSGYGVAADRCLSALHDAGVVTDWLPYVPESGTSMFYAQGLSAAAAPPAAGGSREDPPIVVAHMVPEYFPQVRRERPEAFLVGQTVWETDRLPRHWIACMNAADLLIVPCQFNADVIEDSPVSTPVAVVPYVAPPPLPTRPGALWESIPEETLVFYTIAEWMPRKGVAKTVEAFLRAFTSSDHVMLIVKTSHRDYTQPISGLGGIARRGTTAWALARLLAEHPDPPAVRLVTQELSDDELAGLHVRGDCFVSLCHGEGWGLGSFDAAAHGKPVVTTGFGGQLDYLHGSPLLVDYESVAVHDGTRWGTYTPDQRWAEPDIDHAAELLRAVAKEPEHARALAGERGREIRRRYRPAAVATAFRDSVETALESAPRRAD
jgi:glycosyltransferase involved in cell wall biosynthesis